MKMVAGQKSQMWGYESGNIGTLTPSSFTYNGVTYTITSLYYANVFKEFFTLEIQNANAGQVIKFSVDDVEYQVTYKTSPPTYTSPIINFTSGTTYIIKILSIK